MFRKVVFVLVLGLVALLLACAATDPRENDRTPPIKPVMIGHLGTFGDISYTGVSLTDDNNGIDAVSEGNWIRIQWEDLLDTNIEMIEVYRFDNDTREVPRLVTVIREWRNTEFIDRLLPATIGNSSAIETDWHYFIRAINHAGTYTDSDTVNFRLIEKPVLSNPPDGRELTNAELRAPGAFSWRNMGTSTPSTRMRLLIFDENMNLVWRHDELHATETAVFNTNFYRPQSLPAGTYHWRVDSRGNVDHNGIHSSGSKSMMRSFRIVN